SGAQVETAAVPGAHQDLVARVEPRLGEREVLVRAVVLHREELPGVAYQDDRGAVDLDRDQLPVTQLVTLDDARPADTRRSPERGAGIGRGLGHGLGQGVPRADGQRRAGAARSCPRWS